MEPQAPSAFDELFDALIQRLQTHESYGPAMTECSTKQAQIVLNYHTHGIGHGYCVSIATLEASLIPILGQQPRLKEVAHIRGIGQEETQCVPLMTLLGKKLQQTYHIQKTPAIYLNGHPHS